MHLIRLLLEQYTNDPPLLPIIYHYSTNKLLSLSLDCHFGNLFGGYFDNLSGRNNKELFLQFQTILMF